MKYATRNLIKISNHKKVSDMYKPLKKHKVMKLLLKKKKKKMKFMY